MDEENQGGAQAGMVESVADSSRVESLLEALAYTEFESDDLILQIGNVRFRVTPEEQTRLVQFIQAHWLRKGLGQGSVASTEPPPSASAPATEQTSAERVEPKDK